jgi:hypothetical protein
MPGAGVTVSVTTVWLPKFAVQFDEQLKPVGVFFTVPLPVTLTVRGKVICAKVAVTDCGEFIVTTQLPLPPQAPPQLLNTEPPIGSVKRVTCDPWAKFAMHVDPQLIPGGVLPTMPVPLPVTLTDKLTAGAKVAVADVAPFIVTAQILPALNWQAPPQLAKTQPVAGVAVNITSVPTLYVALQADGQLMPERLLFTVPLPVTLTVILAIPLPNASQ